MAFKKIALKAPSVASTFNEKDIKLWSISGWLEGLDVVGQPISGVITLPQGSFIQNGVVLVETSSQQLTIAGSGTSSDPLILYAVANGPDEQKSPIYAFALRSSIPSNVAEIALNDGVNWSMLQGVSINEIINGIKKVIDQHETPVTAGETITKRDNIRISGGASTGDSAGDVGKAFKSTTDTIDHASVVGVALGGASSGEIFKILTQGVFSDSSLSLSQGKIHFLNTDATFVDAQPASPAITVVLGVALSSVDIVYLPEKTQATFTSFINELETISGIGVEWSAINKIKILNGYTVFNGRQYVLDEITGYKEITLTADPVYTDMDSGNGGLGTNGKDVEKHSTWYYIYAKPNGTTFDPVFSTAPLNGLRRSARHLGTEDRAGVGSINATNYFEIIITGSPNNVFKVKIDGAAQIYTLTINTAGKATDSQIVDLFNTGSAKISVSSFEDTSATATWSPNKPAIRAFSIGNSASKFGVGLCANGKFGSESILDIQSSGNTMNSLLGFVATDGTNPYIGQDWKYMGAVRNNPTSDIIEFSFGILSGFYQFLNINSYLTGELPTATSINFVGEVTQDLASSPFFQTFDFSDLVPVHVQKAYILCAGHYHAGGGGCWIRRAGSDQSPWDVVVYGHEHSSDGGYSGITVITELDNTQKAQAAKRRGSFNLHVLGFFDSR